MTTQNQAKQAINDKFIAEWGATTTYSLANEEFNQPKATAWVRLTVLHVPGGGQETLGKIGNRKYVRRGIIIVNIFIPVETGTEEADLLAKKAQDIFEGTGFNGITVNNSEIREKGVEGKWYHTIMEADFVYYEIK